MKNITRINITDDVLRKSKYNYQELLGIAAKYNTTVNSIFRIFSSKGYNIYFENSKGKYNKQAPTKYFIEKYLNPEIKWNDDLSINERFNEISDNYKDVDSKELVRHINKIGYSEFLKTPYWKAIRDKKVLEHPSCQLCGTDEDLQVHHSTYSILGKEIKNMDKLTVLCHNCHYLYHSDLKNKKIRDSIIEDLRSQYKKNRGQQ